ncbi:MAG TPA: hypothetical protein VK475_07900 [Pyrinomonadaceae bacterium]|nr:hypothetical protein [Pyrinomonadaceae bacterium]
MKWLIDAYCLVIVSMVLSEKMVETAVVVSSGGAVTVTGRSC